MLNNALVGVDGLMNVIGELDHLGYEVWTPAIRDGVVMSRRFQEGDQLPVGYVANQSPGGYELVGTSDRTRFGWVVGPQPWKRLLHPATVTTMTMDQADSDSPVSVSVSSPPDKPLALFGMRPCDLAGVDKLDRVLLDRPPAAEPTYRALRSDAFFVVVNCGVPASTCFCPSVDTGPHVDGRSRSHDLEVTELVDAGSSDDPVYMIDAISDRGIDVLERAVDGVESSPVTTSDRDRQHSQRTSAERAMVRALPAESVVRKLADRHGSTRWHEVAETCLACGNCTAVCPTCFCTAVNDVGDLTATHVERRREWESCFSLEFSRLGSSPVRSSVASRYRQWMTHKLDTWYDHFGESGCVGCGRCTTWCPVGIDFVAVARGIVDDDHDGDSR